MAFRPNVLLGIPDEAIIPESDPEIEWTTNKFGGTPNWTQGPPAEYPQCNVCRSLLPLVSQIYCPLEGSFYHRVLYIFGCTNKLCWNKKESWKVLRFQKLEDQSVQTKVSQTEEKDNWCDEDDEWGEENIDDQQTQNAPSLEEIEYQTKNLRITDSGTLNNMSSHLMKHEQFVNIYNQFVPYYINVIEESQLLSEAKALSRYEKQLLVEYQKREGVDIEEILDSSTQGWGGEKYEQSHAKHGDKIFQKFLKQINLCNQQCLRYNLNGNPLLMTTGEFGEIPCCSSCGHKRIFEMQLMPALVLLLKTNEKHNNQNSISQSTSSSGATNENSAVQKLDSEKTKEGTGTAQSHNIEFGTVCIYTCSNNCWSHDTTFQEEYLIIQSDPDQQHISQF